MKLEGEKSKELEGLCLDRPSVAAGWFELPLFSLIPIFSVRKEAATVRSSAMMISP